MLEALIVLAAFNPTVGEPLLQRPEPRTEQLLCLEPNEAMSVIAQILENSDEAPTIPAGCAKQPVAMSWITEVEYRFTNGPVAVSLVTVDVPNVGPRYSFSASIVE